MKKILLIAALVCSTFILKSQDSKTVFGLKTGVNLSIFSASVNSESSFKPGFHFGGYLKHSIGEKVFFRPELYYSSQGQKDNYQNSPNGPSVGTTTTSLNYINVPLLIETGRKISFQVGPQLGFFISGKEKGTIDNDPVNYDVKNVMKGFDLSLVLGLGVAASEHVNLGFRLNLGLTDIYSGDDQGNVPGFNYPDIKNRVLHFYVAYSF
jgi:hypothetical protein